ncbi:MAG: hypothetical protein PWP28_398 [Oceanotoga sp.]|nr:hypothetical protein [Oceanotoga sp.]
MKKIFLVICVINIVSQVIVIKNQDIGKNCMNFITIEIYEYIIENIKK